MMAENSAGTESSEKPENESPVEKAQETTEAPRPRRRGFAAMDRDRVKEIASKGGKAAHAAGTAHQFSSDEARNAGRKGGMAPHVRRGGVRRRPVEADYEAMCKLSAFERRQTECVGTYLFQRWTAHKYLKKSRIYRNITPDIGLGAAAG